MNYFQKIDRSISTVNRPILGRTLPSLLDEACEHHSNPQGFNQRQANNWQSQSSKELRIAAEELALGLLVEKLKRGDKVALLMHSDLNFCLADFGCLLAGLIDVPIDLTQTLDNIAFILRHSAAKVLIVSDLDLLAQVIPYFGDIPNLETVIVANIPQDWEEKRTQLFTCRLNQKFEVNRSVDNSYYSASTHLNVEQITPNLKLRIPNSKPACLCLPMLLCQGKQNLSCPELPQCIQLFSLDEVRARGKTLWNEGRRQELRSQISPKDTATIVYIAGNTGRPKGVMLSHENISADILTTFNSIPDLKPGARETVLSFLPLTHIFARALTYGHLNYGHSIYFSTPNRAARDFKTVKPTIVATVPRLLEKIYHKMCDRGSKFTGWKKRIFNWALQLAQSYQLGEPKKVLDLLQLKLANWLVFDQVRKSFGGRLKYFISGGAALRGDIANILSATGMTVLQGYGLTETSSVISCNRGQFNRAGTVGLPIAGVKIAIADDGEILVKSPYVMQGYYQDPQATKAVIDSEGWLHTGDLGKFTPEGFLIITGNKKELFKLSTGKYVTPQPLEEQVKLSPLVKQAVAVGRQQKFCGMLIFPELDRLQECARSLNLDLPLTELLQKPEIIALYQSLVDEANEPLPSWSKVKGFELVNGDLTIVNGLLQPDGQVNRAKVNQVFAPAINSLYGEELVWSSEFGIRSSELQLFVLARIVIKEIQNLVIKAKSTSVGQSINQLVHKISFKAKSSWRSLKNYITLPSTILWKLQKNSNLEELE